MKAGDYATVTGVVSLVARVNDGYRVTIHVPDDEPAPVDVEKASAPELKAEQR